MSELTVNPLAAHLPHDELAQPLLERVPGEAVGEKVPHGVVVGHEAHPLPLAEPRHLRGDLEEYTPFLYS